MQRIMVPGGAYVHIKWSGLPGEMVETVCGLQRPSRAWRDAGDTGTTCPKCVDLRVHGKAVQMNEPGDHA